MVLEDSPSGGCPFGGGSRSQNPTPLRDSNRLPTGKARVKLLYEEYIHLALLREVWESPVTEAPVLEPCFAAGMHGIELCFFLLANFVSDERDYVSMRPRIERVADDIATQCKLLTDIVDGELEEEGTSTSRLTLVQDFPFPGAPPSRSHPSHSPGLAALEAAVRAVLPALTTAERNSLIKVVINLTTAAFGCFQRWSVGLGVEPQLNNLRKTVGLAPLALTHLVFLDYDGLVRPAVVAATARRRYAYHEDFFFRTIHLGTECWARVALARLRSAADNAKLMRWNVATARIGQAARVLEYLGSHVMLLTSMNLRDYLQLKVELEGTSGEGSVQVKSFRPMIASLMNVLEDHLLNHPKYSEREHDFVDSDARSARLAEIMMHIYEHPDEGNQDIYNYAKALEEVESALLGGFFFKHFCLAANVIGSDAKGTMRRAVQGLKVTYETPVFPLLDRVRSRLGAKVDAELAHVKGRMMQEIIDRYVHASKEGNRTTAASCPFGAARTIIAYRSQEEALGKKVEAPQEAIDVCATPTVSSALARLYSWNALSSSTQIQLRESMRKYMASLSLKPHSNDPLGRPIAFLDHAWGQSPPAALHAALRDVEALYHLGNPSWVELFSRIMPEAEAHLKRLLGIPVEAARIHFGHNSHELVTRLLSQLLLAGGAGGEQSLNSRRVIRVLASDCEFYSITRQLNRLQEAGAVDVCIVPSEPVDSFANRCVSEIEQAATGGSAFDIVYVSQVTYLTQVTLLPDIPAFVNALDSVQTPRNSSQDKQLVIIDGYHAFCAIPVELGEAAGRCCYIGGLLKHAGGGSNCAFISIPSHLELRPVFTGWIADPSVLGPTSAGIRHGSQVSYAPELALQGGTPAFNLPLLTFNHSMRLWSESIPSLTVQTIHEYVMELHEKLLMGLPARGDVGLTRDTVLPRHALVAARSHTLVFKQPTLEAASDVVDRAKKAGVLIDNRKVFVRVGLGPNHSMADIDALLTALC